MGSNKIHTKHDTFDKGLRENIKAKTTKAIKQKKKKNDKSKEENLKKIMEIIQLFSLNEGIQIKELSKLIGIQRRNIQYYIAILKSKKLISKDNKTGRIKSTSTYFEKWEENKYLTWRLAQGFLNMNTKQLLTLRSKDEVKAGNYKSILSNLNRIKETKEKGIMNGEDHLGRLLYEFSNRIGSYITYLILQNINPKFISQQESTGISTKVIEQAVLRNIALGTINIVDNSKSSLFFRFTRMIYDNYGPTPFEKNGKNEINEMRLTMQFFNDLLTSFSNIYPYLVEEYDKIQGKNNISGVDLNNKESEIKTALENYMIRRRKREIMNECDHEFEEIIGVFNGKEVTKSIHAEITDTELGQLEEFPLKGKYQLCKKCRMRISNSEINDSSKLSKKKAKDVI